MDKGQLQIWEYISKREMGEVRGTCWIRVHEVPFWGVGLGNYQLELLGISGVTGRWDRQDRR